MKVGFIGGGNMASAMIGGMIQKGVVSADDILVSVRTEKSVERLTNQFGVQATMENEAQHAVVILLQPKEIELRGVGEERSQDVSLGGKWNYSGKK